MKKETIIKLKNEWKEMSNNSNKPDGVNTMLYLLLIKTEENFFKSYTGLKNEIKLKNTVYDYNYNVILYTNLIEIALNNYIKTGNIRYNLLKIAAEDETFDISSFVEKFKKLSTPLRRSDYARWHSYRYNS